ncbi:MAG: hypothetical protein Q9218_003725 [Villophora microphyllina]
MRINNTTRRTIWEQVSGGFQDLADLTSIETTRSIVGKVVDLPTRTHCRPPCHRREVSRIALVEKKSEDGSIYLAPVFHGCTCQPAWREQHRRQLIDADLRNKKCLGEQLSTVQHALQDMLARHREISKAQLNQEKYWLQQHYARMINARNEHNRELHKEADKVPKAANHAKTIKGKVSARDREESLQVDKENLWVDPEFYEDPFALSCADTISTEEVLDRFNDLKQRATAMMHAWDQEKASLTDLIVTAYPQPGSSDSWDIAEDRPYCAYTDFGFHLLREPPDTQAEVLRCDIWADQQQAATADRSSEISKLLQEISQHLIQQIADIEEVEGGEGRRRALISYLRRYEQQGETQLPEKTPASAVGTWELVALARTMVRRWHCEDATRRNRFDMMVQDDQALDAM